MQLLTISANAILLPTTSVFAKSILCSTLQTKCECITTVQHDFHKQYPGVKLPTA